MIKKLWVVVPNWNGADNLVDCLNSLQIQTQSHQVVLVDNGSQDNSIQLVEKQFRDVRLIRHTKNYGFAGGVNAGIKLALQEGADAIALFNNDAVADKNWLKYLVDFLAENPKAAIVTSKICDITKSHLDSTGDQYTVWGLPYPRGRGEPYSSKYDQDKWVFAASGGASLYRAELFNQIGFFDEDFFAYYEDVDISFRAQLAGWKIGYEPRAEVYHQIGATSGNIKGFTTYQTLKNLPLLMWKNVPWPLMPSVWPRLVLAYFGFLFSALSRRQFSAIFKGLVMGSILWPKKLIERRKIQSTRKVNVEYINSIITHDLPPNAGKLRKLRNHWWRLTGKVLG